MITVSGRVGTLNEFTIAFEDKKPQGVLTGTGGESEEIENILKIADRGMGKVVFNDDPGVLLDKVVAMIKADEKQIKPSDLFFSKRRVRG